VCEGSEGVVEAGDGCRANLGGNLAGGGAGEDEGIDRIGAVKDELLSGKGAHGV
jgi:hypothetical protein